MTGDWPALRLAVSVEARGDGPGLADGVDRLEYMVSGLRGQSGLRGSWIMRTISTEKVE